MPQSSAPQSQPPTLLIRMVRNLGWLSGGKAAGAILSLVYLGLAARSLGPVGFGAFSMVLAFGQAVANFVQFQSWQLVIRFGARHLADEQPGRLETLLRFSTLLDLFSAVTSAVIGFVIVDIVARVLGWAPEVAADARWFSLSLLFWLRATPTGVLRLFDRFDQLTMAETITPVVRFIGAVIAAFFAPTIGAFLAIWAISEASASIALWMMARTALRQRGVDFHLAWPTGVVAQNPGLRRFAWASNASSATNLVWQQLGTLAVGGAVGEAAAGGYRMAFQIAQALAKPALLLGRVIYPELARLGAAGRFDQAVWRVTMTAGAAGIAMIALTALAGRPALTLIAGSDYAVAAPLLTILSVSAAIDLCGFAMEPALLAAGRAGHALIARASGALAFAALLTATIGSWGVYGAAWSSVAGSAIAIVISVALLRRALAHAPMAVESAALPRDAKAELE